MAQDTYPANIGKAKLLSAAGGGTALTTTRAFIAIPAGVKNIIAIPRNFTAPAAVVKVALNPLPVVFMTQSAMASNPTQYTEELSDGNVATVATFSSLPTLANGGAIYVGVEDVIAGLVLDIILANSGGGTMAVHYWNAAWTTITPTDNTANMANDGSITWTVPTDWVKAKLDGILAVYNKPGIGQHLYWLRITTSAAYDASTTVASMYAINKAGDALNELLSGQTFQSWIDRAANGGCLQALVDAGTGSLIVNGYN